MTDTLYRTALEGELRPLAGIASVPMAPIDAMAAISPVASPHAGAAPGAALSSSASHASRPAPGGGSTRAAMSTCVHAVSRRVTS